MTATEAQRLVGIRSVWGSLEHGAWCRGECLAPEPALSVVVGRLPQAAGLRAAVAAESISIGQFSIWTRYDTHSEGMAGGRSGGHAERITDHLSDHRPLVRLRTGMGHAAGVSAPGCIR